MSSSPVPAGNARVPVVVPDIVASLLGLRAVARVDDVREVRLTNWVERPAGGWPLSDRAAVRDTAVDGARAVVDGRMVVERAAQHRWLAWFPRPVGPHHAVNVASPAIDVLAEHVDRLELARAHVAMRTWEAELMQALANLARWERGRRLLDRWVERGSTGDDRSRWACVVEVLAGPDMLVRAWSYGTARGATATVVADHMAACGVGPELHVPSDATVAAVLDAVADDARVDLRWSVGAPATIER